MDEENISISSDIQIYNPTQAVDIFEMEELEEMSVAEYQKAKKNLAERRKQLMLMLDDKKLKHATKIMNALELTMDRYFEGYSKEDVSASDLKCLADAHKSLLASLNTISRLDSVDNYGKSARLSLEIKFE